jgi:hypothetical protein
MVGGDADAAAFHVEQHIIRVRRDIAPKQASIRPGRVAFARLIGRMPALLEHRAAARAQLIDVLLHAGGDLVRVRNLGAAKVERVAAAGFFLVVSAGGVRRADRRQGKAARGDQGSCSVHGGSRRQVDQGLIQSRSSGLQRNICCTAHQHF